MLSDSRKVVGPPPPRRLSMEVAEQDVENLHFFKGALVSRALVKREIP